jgi:hypothetical protein
MQFEIPRKAQQAIIVKFANTIGGGHNRLGILFRYLKKAGLIKESESEFRTYTYLEMKALVSKLNDLQMSKLFQSILNTL